MTQLIEADSKKLLKAFIDFPHKLYCDDPNYVPELFIAQRDMLTPGKHPFHEHAIVKLFLARKNGKVTGRIAAILNHNHNDHYQSNDGFFGFFDCINDQETANLLINAASAWLKRFGISKLAGPASFSSHEVYGLLIEGFDRPPVAMMPYNAPYYPQLLQGAGLKKQTDLFAWYFSADRPYNDKSKQLLGALQERLKRNNIVIRKINMKKFEQEAEKIRALYNDAWSENSGSVPITESEFLYMAKDMKMIIDPDFCILAEQEGKIVGMGLALPDINQVLINIKRGRLLPTGLFKLLAGRKKIRGLRLLLLGVAGEYRKMGIEACCYGTIIKEFENKRMEYLEASWTLEHNTMINRAIQNINGDLYKKYRVFEKAI